MSGAKLRTILSLVPAALAGCQSVCAFSFMPPDVTDDGVGGFEGWICTPNREQVLGGVRVAAEDSAGTRWETTSDVDGRFFLDQLPPGEYNLTAQIGHHVQTRSVTLADSHTHLLLDGLCLARRAVNATVLGTKDDPVQTLLVDLGFDIDIRDGTDLDVVANLLLDPTEFEALDVLYLPSGLNLSRIDGREAEVAENLIHFIDRGGSIYASDDTAWLIERTWPHMLDLHGEDTAPESAVGLAGVVQANVLDQDLRDLIERNTAEITFLQDDWTVAVGTDETAEVLVEANVSAQSPDGTRLVTSPLAVRYDTEGRVVFSAFHIHDGVITPEMQAILLHTVLSL